MTEEEIAASRAADAWVRTDPQSIIGDIRRLGFETAVEYNIDLAIDRAAAGDRRWAPITASAMREAMRAKVA